MSNEEIKNLAISKTPKVKLIEHKNYYRHDVLEFLNDEGCIGIELGVAGGHFSDRMMKSGKFDKFYGVDLYEDHHNTAEYIKALKLVGLEQNYVLLRISFDEAIELFDDNYFDFIYFDGYAHTGEEGGKTFNDWFKKLKVGGLFAGDDYHEDWPLVKWAVNDMVSQIGCDLHVTGKRENTNLNWYPSWFFKKLSEADFTTNPDLRKLSELIRKSTKQNSGQISVTKEQLFALINNWLQIAPENRIELIDLISQSFKNSEENFQKNKDQNPFSEK